VAGLVSDATRDQIYEMIRIVLREEPLFNTGQDFFNHDDGNTILLGKTTTAHAKDATETINLYGVKGDTLGSENLVKNANDVTTTIEAYNRFADVATDMWVLCFPVSTGYELIAAEC
jgi:hypothetical protein